MNQLKIKNRKYNRNDAKDAKGYYAGVPWTRDKQ